MSDIQKYCIPGASTIREALVALNSAPSRAMTLIVVDGGKAVGTLTDGDIRRALIAGAGLDSSVATAMHRDFRALTPGSSVRDIKAMREQGVALVPVIDDEGRLTDVCDFSRQLSMLPVDAVLMAGGKGERLRPLTEHTPKPLLPVGDKAIIDHNVDRLVSYGITNISVTVNYLKEQIIDHYSEHRGGVRVRCVDEPEFMGTIGSVQYVGDFSNDTVLVMNSDLFTNINYEDFYIHFLEHDADMSVAAVPYSVAVPYGIMDLDGRKLKGMIEKPVFNYYANGGIYLIRREHLSLIPKGQRFDATDLIDTLIVRGANVVRFPINGAWIDIGNPQEYQKACDLAKHLR